MSILISNSSPAFASLSTYLGPCAFFQPGCWTAPSLVEISRDTFEIKPIPVNSTQALVSGIHAGQIFLAAPKRPSETGRRSATPPPTAPPSLEEADEIFSDLERRLSLIKPNERRYKLWTEFRDLLAFLPETDLPKAPERIAHFVTELVLQFYQDGKKSGTLWTAAGFYQEMKNFRGERRSLGGLAMRAIHELPKDVRLKAFDTFQADVQNWLQKKEGWDENDLEFLAALWNEPLRPPLEAELVSQVVARITPLVFQSDLADLQVARRTAKVATLFAEAPVKDQTVGDFIRSDIDPEIFRKRKKFVELRVEGGEGGWDAAWDGSLQPVPKTEAGFVSLEISGETVTLDLRHVQEELVAEVGLPEGNIHFQWYVVFLMTDPAVDGEIKSRTRKRFSDVRINQENADAAFWTFLQEMAHGEEELRRKLLQTLRQFQGFALRVMKAPAFDSHSYFGSAASTPNFSPPDQRINGIDEILEEGGALRVRVGDNYIWLSKKWRAKLSADDALFAAAAFTGLRYFSEEETAAFSWVELSDAERKHLQGLRELYLLGSKMSAVLGHFEVRRLTAEPAEKPDLTAYKNIVRQVADKEISPPEGAGRILKMALRDFPEIFGEGKFSFLFREPVEPAEEQKLADQFLAGLPEVILQMFKDAGWFNPLSPFGIRMVFRDYFGSFRPSPLAGEVPADTRDELLKLGRSVSPHDDRYTLEEFQALMAFQSELNARVMRRTHPVTHFKEAVAKGDAPFGSMSETSNFLLLKGAVPTEISFPKFIEAYFKKLEISEEKRKAGLRLSLVHQLCWLEVVLYAMADYLKFVRGEEYDEAFMKALVSLYYPDADLEKQYEGVLEWWDGFKRKAGGKMGAEPSIAKSIGLAGFYQHPSQVETGKRSLLAEIQRRFRKGDFDMPKDHFFRPKNEREKRRTVYHMVINSMTVRFFIKGEDE